MRHITASRILFLILIGQGAVVLAQPPSPDGNPPVSVEPPISSNEADPADYVEITYQGKTIRMPIRSGSAESVQLGNSSLQLQFISGPNESAAQGATTHAVQSGPISPSGEHPANEGFQLTRENLILVGSLGAVVLGLLGYMFVIDPIRRRRPLKEALSILARELKSEYGRAEELLDQSLLAGLKKKDITTARYALAYLRTLLGKFEEAATVLGDMEKSNVRIDRATAYLRLYVDSKLKNHERVERTYQQHENLLKGFRQSDLIVSISFLELAQLRWARRAISGALHYFNEVRRLKVLAAEVPSHIDDHEVIVGVSSLFEKNTAEAERHFQVSIDEATAQQKQCHAGRIGLALCHWCAGQIAEVDAELHEILSEMSPESKGAGTKPIETQCPHCGRGYKVKPNYLGEQVQCKSCRRRFEVQEIQEPGSSEDEEKSPEDPVEELLSDADILLRNVRLWHCVVRLVGWQGLPAKSGLPHDERKILNSRLRQVTLVDSEWGDPHLIAGLMKYYFARTDDERREGLQHIEAAVKKDVHLPEVLQLIEREHKLASLSEHSLTYFHQLLRKYVANPEVAPHHRQRLARKMNSYESVRRLGALSEDSETSAVPSLEELRGRGQILANRVSNILKFRISDSEEEIKGQISSRLDEMKERTRTLTETAESLQKTEFELMEHTGEFLFRDEEPEGTNGEA